MRAPPWGPRGFIQKFQITNQIDPGYNTRRKRRRVHTPDMIRDIMMVYFRLELFTVSQCERR